MFSALFFLFAQIPDQGMPVEPQMVQPDLGPIPAIAAGIELVLVVLIVASFWKIFTKAGQPGWAAIVPFYNVYIYCKVINKPGWWVILLIFPCTAVVMYPVSLWYLAKAFGHDVGYFLGLFFLGFIFLPMLAFGKSQYVGAPA